MSAGDNLAIAADNSTRYAPVVALVHAIDSKQLVAIYIRFDPLVQQAYRDLGYPDGYFNDRLVAVIDHLLATPSVKQPIALVQPKVLYQYADPELEALSAGQKAMLRIGPENAAVVKAKLREIRFRVELPQPVRNTRPVLCTGRLCDCGVVCTALAGDRCVVLFRATRRA
jgi:hypothetical protein